LLGQRRALSRQEVETGSAAVNKALLESGLLENVEVVALYAAADNEVLTRPLYERLRDTVGKIVLPRVIGQGPLIEFFPVLDWDALVLSRLGIPEPTAEGEPVEPETFDFVAVPGVGFDAHGGRLGYGMGCYDRVLARVRAGAPLVGIGYDFQLVERVPMDEHDVPLTAVAAPSGIVTPCSGEIE